MRYMALAILSLCSTATLADTVVDELSERSQIPVSELISLLSDCDKTQLSMNICAYRDFIAADLQLEEQLAALPASCAGSVHDQQSDWEQARDASCNQAADDEALGGSMRPMIFSFCRTQATAERMDAIAALCEK